nr:Ribosomal protein L7 L12 domain containing protein [Haemonchus contortus]
MSVLARFRPTLVNSARTGLRLFSAANPSGLPLNEGAPAPPPPEEHVPSPKIAALVEEIANLRMMMAAQAPAASAEAAAPAEPDVPQKMTFSVKLTKFDDAKKIALIKEIRSLVPGLNLVQAKKFVETAPVVVKDDMGKAEAEEMKAALEKAGGTVEIV